MLRLEGVSRIYPGAKAGTRALDGVSLEVAAGEFVAIMGPSGCGKSTLLHILGLLDRPTAGRYWFCGEEVGGYPESKLARLRSEKTGFVFQSFNLIEDLSVADNVEAALIYRGMKGAERRRRVQEVLDKVGIAAEAKQKPARLSGGQQQRAALARALVSDPALILADEPTGNLDTANGEAVMALLKGAVADGVTVVMVTHSPDHAREAQRVIQLLDGRVVA